MTTHRQRLLTAMAIVLAITQGWRVATLSPAAMHPRQNKVTPAIEREVLNDGHAACAELRPTSEQLAVDVLSTPDVETLLFLTACDVPSRSQTVTVAVTPSHDRSPSRLVWNRVRDFTPQPEFPVLPPTPDVTEPLEIPSTETATQEHFFLPSPPGAPARSKIPTAISTTLVVRDGRVRVMWDDGVPLDAGMMSHCRHWAARLNKVLIPRAESVFGPVADRDPDGTLTLVITPQVRSSTSTGSPVEAFVLASDFRRDGERPASNACDAIYVHPELNGDRSDAILVHELTHAAQFCALRRHYGDGPWPLTEWMLEGTAHAAEVLLAHSDRNVTDRLRAFRHAPERSPLMVADSSVSGRWRDPRCRGATCSFFTWAARRHGLETIAQVAVQPQTEHNPWQCTTGQTWDALHRDWLISLATERSVVARPAAIGTPLIIEIDGSATGVIALPPTTASQQTFHVTVNGANESQWRGMLVRRPRYRGNEESDGPVRDYWGMGTALASPVTTIR